jgi:hypothetical protein
MGLQGAWFTPTEPRCVFVRLGADDNNRHIKRRTTATASFFLLQEMFPSNNVEVRSALRFIQHTELPEFGDIHYVTQIFLHTRSSTVLTTPVLVLHNDMATIMCCFKQYGINYGLHSGRGNIKNLFLINKI